MSDTDLGNALPDEQSYFESGGATEIPAGEKAAEQEVKTESEPKPEPGEGRAEGRKDGFPRCAS